MQEVPRFCQSSERGGHILPSLWGGGWGCQISAAKIKKPPSSSNFFFLNSPLSQIILELFSVNMGFLYDVQLKRYANYQFSSKSKMATKMATKQTLGTIFRNGNIIIYLLDTLRIMKMKVRKNISIGCMGGSPYSYSTNIGGVVQNVDTASVTY